MNEMIDQLAEQCYVKTGSSHTDHFAYWKFAELIVKECINTLEFHGFDDAIPYVKWMATNKLGQHFGLNSHTKDQSVCGND